MSTEKKAVFLDKDGTLVKNVPYNVDPELVSFEEGVCEGLERLAGAGYDLFIVSNQPGVALGLFEEQKLSSLQLFFESAFGRMGSRLSGFYYCPHHPQGRVPGYALSCQCRKPAPGLLQRAAQEHGVSLAQSWFIGDILDDIEAGRRAGCRTVLIDNGNETEWLRSALREPHVIATSFDQAADAILRSASTRAVS